MNALELAAYIGKAGTLHNASGVLGLSFDVRVVNARISYGGLQLEIEPIAGTGKRWVEARKVALQAVA